MKILRNLNEMNEASKELRKKNISIGFIPTMGALHEGHLSLIRQARRDNDRVIVSIFLNPAQFGPNEDLSRYPKPIKQDIALCRKEGVDILFHPRAKDMYPADFKTVVTVEALSDVLCGAFRPGHFKGVATVVTKLFNIVQPDFAYFGQKDIQQAVIIKQMARDLNLPVKIKSMPVVRDKNGLALSSRNAYLRGNERNAARLLFQSLCLAQGAIKAGVKDSALIIRKIKSLVAKNKKVKLEYAALVDANNLRPIKRISGKTVIALAVWIGKTRLIDNMVIDKK